MPILHLLELQGKPFGPEEIEALTRVYKDALADLGLVDRRAPAAVMVANRVIALAKEGACDPMALRERVVRSFKNGVGNTD